MPTYLSTSPLSICYTDCQHKQTRVHTYTVQTYYNVVLYWISSTVQSMPVLLLLLLLLLVNEHDVHAIVS